MRIKVGTGRGLARWLEDGRRAARRRCVQNLVDVAVAAPFADRGGDFNTTGSGYRTATKTGSGEILRAAAFDGVLTRGGSVDVGGSEASRRPTSNKDGPRSTSSSPRHRFSITPLVGKMATAPFRRRGM